MGIKCADSFLKLDDACEEAMTQVKTHHCDERLRDEWCEDILAYGIAFYKKRCKAVCEKL